MKVTIHLNLMALLSAGALVTNAGELTYAEGPFQPTWDSLSSQYQTPDWFRDAKYFMALANHHDNFDLYDSKHQPWNSVALGPKKDLVGGWAKAAKKHGLRFGVSVHASRAGSWYEPVQIYGEGPFTLASEKGKFDGQTALALKIQP